jgi:hypothetical protein
VSFAPIIGCEDGWIILAQISINRDTLNRWLEGKPIEWAQIIAVRLALRVLPLALVPIAKGEAGQRQCSRFLAVFRANHVSWCARRYPYHEMCAAAAGAAAAAASAVPDTGSVHTALSARTADFAARAAATSDAAVVRNATDAAAALAEATFRAALQETSTVAIGTDADVVLRGTKTVLWLTVWADMRELENGIRSVIDRPLWLPESWGDLTNMVNIPDIARARLDAFAADTDAARAGFGPWVEWYRGLLRGQPSSTFGEAIDVRIVRRSRKWWKREPPEINAEIAAWLEKGRDRLTMPARRTRRQ